MSALKIHIIVSLPSKNAVLPTDLSPDQKKKKSIIIIKKKKIKLSA